MILYLDTSALVKLYEAGYRLAILPGALLVPAIAAAEAALSHILKSGTVATPSANLSIRDVFRRVGAGDCDAVRARIAS